MADLLYTRGLASWGAFTSGTVTAMLLDDTHTPNIDNDFVADVVADELTNGSYARVNLASRTQTIDDTNNLIKWDAADVTFSTLSGAESVGYCVLYKFVTNDADSILLALFDLTDYALVTSGADEVIRFGTNGISRVSQA